MSVEVSKWKETRVVARNRVEKAMAQSRAIATEVVAHFSDETCEAISQASDEEVRQLVESQANVLKSKALIEHREDVAKTFAMAAVAEAARGEKSPEQVVAAVIAADSFDEIVSLVMLLDDETIEKLDEIAAKFRLACEQVKAGRQPKALPPAKSEEASTPTTTETTAEAEGDSPADSPAEIEDVAATEPEEPPAEAESREAEAANVSEDEQTKPDATA